MMRYVFEKLKRFPRKLLFLSSYFLFYHREAIAKLSRFGFAEVRAFRIQKWRRFQTGNVFRYYYTAQFNGEKCFVKLSNDSTIVNEIFVNSYITQCGVSFVPKLLIGDTNYAKDSYLLALEFRSDLSNFRLPDDEKAFESLCHEFRRVYDKFKEFGIIHGDISASNLLLDTDNRISLIDFGIGRVPGSEAIEIDMNTHCGTYYRTNKTGKVYDDVYSFLCMLDDCGIPAAYKQKECYKNIKSLIGTHTYKISV